MTITTAAARQDRHIIPHHPPAAGGPGDPLVFASSADGSPAGFPVTGESPHMIVAGATGSGLTVTCRVLCLEAARRGITVRAGFIREPDAYGLRDWPNITAGGGPLETAALIGATFDDMMSRYADVEAGRFRPGDYRRILLVIDEYTAWSLLAGDHWARMRGDSARRECPALGQLAALTWLSRGALINLVIAARSPKAACLPPGFLATAGTRVALGRQTAESAEMMFGDPTAGCDIPPGAAGAGTVLGPAGRGRATMHWLPDPARWNDPVSPLTTGERQLLLDMLPPGSRWDGSARGSRTEVA